MGKTTDPIEAVPAEPVMSLTDFCTRLSETVRRPELIGAFFRTHKVKRATWEEFRASFDQFVNSPA
jgi:hypothetical protein